MGWFEDLGGALKKGAKATGKGLDKASDTLIDKQAWKNTAQAMLDGPGGKEVKMSDLANIALDSTMLIPGAGVVGGAARVGTRLAAREAGKAAAGKAEQKLVQAALRSNTNNAVRKKVSEGAAKLTSKVGTGDAGKVVSKAAEPLLKQTGRIAGKQEAKVGTKVGFGQTKKRILKTAAMTGGANLLARGYDTAFDARGPAAAGATGATGGAAAGGAGGGFYLTGADGSSTALPAEFQKALAAFMNQGGSPDGAQVIYLGN